MTTTPELIERPAAVAPEPTAAAPQAAAPEASARREPARSLVVTPAVDIVEDAQGVTLRADLPGVEKAGLDLRVQDARLTIDARAELPETPGLREQHAEWHAPRYLRSFSLSPYLDTSRIDASLRDGVLTLRIARREEALPRKIEIGTGAA
ncbi:Hsp20/alpha crystallin family protein [Burkholderia glumae]|uniref:Hsp20/alpha crystallin family protein n=1 Tax=Burkholderia glumae TaxID=337 RepID=UPI001462B8E9|nr:Hsp20/alpha crystallin family protein [Burkholderia glumae]QJP71200.1 Hsp20/alpha crystallin family protein [Burkholderia glumae]